MRITLALILSVIVAVGLVAFGFTFFQVSSERTRLQNDLESRISKISEELLVKDSLLFGSTEKEKIEHFADSVVARHGLLGMAIYYSRYNIVASTSTRTLVYSSQDEISKLLAFGSSSGNFITVNGNKMFLYIRPVAREDKSINAIIVYAGTSYIDKTLAKIWFRNFMRWFIQAFLVSLLTILIIRWGIFNLINNFVMWVKAVRTGDAEHMPKKPLIKFLAPLHNEIEHIAKAMQEAKATAWRKPRLRTQLRSNLDSGTPED